MPSGKSQVLDNPKMQPPIPAGACSTHRCYTHAPNLQHADQSHVSYASCIQTTCTKPAARGPGPCQLCFICPNKHWLTRCIPASCCLSLLHSPRSLHVAASCHTQSMPLSHANDMSSTQNHPGCQLEDAVARPRHGLNTIQFAQHIIQIDSTLCSRCVCNVSCHVDELYWTMGEFGLHPLRMFSTLGSWIPTWLGGNNISTARHRNFGQTWAQSNLSRTPCYATQQSRRKFARSPPDPPTLQQPTDRGSRAQSDTDTHTSTVGCAHPAL